MADTRIPPPAMIAAPLPGAPHSPRLRRVNPDAVAYASTTGQRFEEVYPKAIREIRKMAPRARAPEALEYVRMTGLHVDDVYPPSAERPRGLWWAGTIVGMALGGLVGGSTWAVAGALGGGALEWLRESRASRKGSR